MYHQRVAWLRAFDIEGSGFRIRPLAALHTRRIDAAGIDGVRNHVVAGLDTKCGLMGARKCVVKFLGLEPMGFSQAGRGQGKGKNQSHTSLQFRSV